jgi:hypothetical protein
MKWFLGLAIAAALTGCGPDDGGAARTPGAPASPPASPPASAPAAASPDKAPERRAFRDWRAVCDNGDRCLAYSGTDATTWIRIASSEQASANGPCIGFGIGFVGASDSPDPVTLSADGRPLLRMRGRDGHACAEALSGTIETAPAALADARALTLAGGGRTEALPAAGLKAALLWIDERQGRLDTSRALVRRGSRPVSDIPAPPALPAAVPAPVVAQTGFEGAQNPMEGDPPRPLVLSAALKAIPWVQECLTNTADRPFLRDAVLAARLGARTELWGVPCESGAYNISYLMFVTGPEGSNPRLATLPDPAPVNAAAVSRGWEDEALTNPVYDPATRVLSHFPRGRGLGDCGLIQSWTWTDRGFQPREMRAMDECWGLPPDLWPTTWRTR